VKENIRVKKQALRESELGLNEAMLARLRMHELEKDL
jgi:hypothetical protein